MNLKPGMYVLTKTKEISKIQNIRKSEIKVNEIYMINISYSLDNNKIVADDDIIKASNNLTELEQIQKTMDITR